MDSKTRKLLIATQEERQRLATEATRLIAEAGRTINALHDVSRELRKELKANNIPVESMRLLETPKAFVVKEFLSGLGLEPAPPQTLAEELAKEGRVMMDRIDRAVELHGQPVKVGTWNDGGRHE